MRELPLFSRSELMLLDAGSRGWEESGKPEERENRR